MTSTDLQPNSSDTTNDNDDLCHFICDCNPDRALCGWDVSDEPFVSPHDKTICVVCDDLVVHPCKNPDCPC